MAGCVCNPSWPHLDGGNLVNVGLDGEGELEHELATLYTGGVETPDGVECLLGSIDCTVDIPGGSLCDFSDLFARGRVDNLQGSGNGVSTLCYRLCAGALAGYCAAAVPTEPGIPDCRIAGGDTQARPMRGHQLGRLTSMVLPPSPSTNSLLMKRPVASAQLCRSCGTGTGQPGSPPEKVELFTPDPAPKFKLSVGAIIDEFVCFIRSRTSGEKEGKREPLRLETLQEGQPVATEATG